MTCSVCALENKMSAIVAGSLDGDDRRPLVAEDENLEKHTQSDTVENSSPAKTDSDVGYERTTESAGEPIIYARRWYALSVFSLLAFTQGCVWNTWGPLAATSEPAFGWNDGVIALMSNWGPIAYLVGTPVLTWLMDVKGLRWACLLVGGFLLLGTGLRCITSTPPLATGLIHVGQFLNGLGGPLVQGGCPLVSAVWFPVYQRATATALGSMMGGLGVGLSFIIGPLLVPMPNTTSTFCNSSSEVCRGNWSTTDIHDTRQDIMRLMYIEFGWTAVIFLAILVYFPARPPTPPSYSASHQRIDFKQGLKLLFKHRGFWMLGLPYALASGVFNCWGSVIDVVLKPLGISQDEAGWLGFYGTIAGNIAGLAIARFADLFSRHMKLFLIFLFSGATATFVVFCLTCIKVIPFTSVTLYITLILGSVFVCGSVPLFYELVCESTYPIAEGVTNGYLTLLNNLSGLVFLLILMIPNIGTSWMNWTMVGCVAISLPILCLFRESYNRLDIDTLEVEPNDGHSNNINA